MTRQVSLRRNGRLHPLMQRQASGDPSFLMNAIGPVGTKCRRPKRSRFPLIASATSFGKGQMIDATTRTISLEGGRTPPASMPHVFQSGQRSDELARVEAVLFLARDPLPVRRIAKLARLADGTRARSLLKELQRLYESDTSPFRIESVAGGFQILTHPAFGPWLRRLLDSHSQHRLSAAAMETLAVVAYRQPVSRADIEAIRGVGCEEMIRQLLDRDLVAVAGRSEQLGRPHLYGTTRQFLRVFGLARLEDLPAVLGPVPDAGADDPRT